MNASIRLASRQLLVLACSAFLLSACVSYYVGQLDSADSQTALRRIVSPGDGQIQAQGVGMITNVDNLMPGAIAALFTGGVASYRPHSEPLVVLVTEKSLLFVGWDWRSQTYHISRRIPITAIQDVWLYSLIGIMRVDFELAQSDADGNPSARGTRMRINGMDRETGEPSSQAAIELYAALAQRLRTIRPEWQPRPVPASAEEALRSLQAPPS